MKSEVTEVAACRQKIDITIDADQVDATYDKVFGELQGSVQIKGFRKGHAPRRLLERRYSTEVSQDVRARLFEESLKECMEDNKIAPLGDPDIKIEDLEAKPGEAFSYSTEVDVRPKFDLPDYKEIKLTESRKTVSDEEVAKKIAELQKRFAENKPVEEAAQEGDTLQATAIITAGEEEITNLDEAQVPVEADLILGCEVENSVAELAGLKAGDSKTITATLPDTYHKNELRGKEVTIKLDVTEVKRPEFPELNQQFAQKLGLDDMAALGNAIRDNLQSEADTASYQELESNLIDKLIGLSQFDLPEQFMERQREQANLRAQYQLAQMGATQEFLTEQKDELEKSSNEETERIIRWTIISEAIADAEKIEVDEADFQRHIQQLCQHYNTTPKEFIKSVQERNGLAAMGSEILNIKTTKFLLDQADVTVEGGSVEAEADDTPAAESADDTSSDDNHDAD